MTEMIKEIKFDPIVPLPNGWADNLVNVIIWGDKKHFYTPKKK